MFTYLYTYVYIILSKHTFVHIYAFTYIRILKRMYLEMFEPYRFYILINDPLK
jgi:hypothetical protein